MTCASAIIYRSVYQFAKTRWRSLLVLETRKGGIAEGLYRKLGYIDGGVIPGYARTVNGTLVAEAFFNST